MRAPTRRLVSPRAITGQDHRVELTPPGVGGVATYTSESRKGCRLAGVPARLLWDRAGTMTRAEYLAWASRDER